MSLTAPARPVLKLVFGFLLPTYMMLASTSAQPIPIASIERSQPVSFQKEILPILQKKCLACHNATDAESDLVLETPDTILKGGFEGPAVAAGQPDESLMLQLATKGREPVMPPEDNDAGATFMTSEELGLLKLWIEQGAKGDEIAEESAIRWQPLPLEVVPVYAVTQSVDGRYVAAGRANQAWVYDLLLRQYVDRLADPDLADSPVSRGQPLAHLDLVQSLAFSHDGQWIASGGYRTVKLWKRTALSENQTPLPVAPPIQLISGGNELLYTANEAGTIFLVPVDSSRPAQEFHQFATGIAALAASETGDFVAASGNDLQLGIWKSDGRLIQTLSLPAAARQLAWLGDTQLAAACADGTVRIWSLDAAGQLTQPRSLSGQTSPMTTLAWLSDEKLASAGEDGKVRLWSLSSAEVLQELDHGAPINRLAASAAGQRLVTAGGNLPAKLWDAETAKLIAVLDTDPRRAWQHEQLTWAQQVASRQVDNLQEDLQTARQRVTEEEENLKKSRDSQEQAEQEQDKSRNAAEQATAEQLAAEQALAAAQAEVVTAEKAVADATQEDIRSRAAARLSEAQQAVATAEKTLQEKTKAAGSASEQLRQADQALDSATRSVRTSETALEDAKQQVTDLEPELEAARQHHQTGETQLAQATEALQKHPVIAPYAAMNETLITTWDEQGKIVFWRSDDGRPLDTITLPDDPIVSITLASETKALVITRAGKRYGIDIAGHWRLARTIGSPDDSSPLADRVTAISFSPDDTLLAIGGGQPSRSGELKIFRVDDGGLEQELPEAHSDTIFGLAFSPDGRRLASCGADRFMKVFDVASGKLQRAFEGHTHHVLSVSWRADGRVLATGGADAVVKLWKTSDGSQLRTIEGFGKEVTAIQFSGASDEFYATCGDRQLYRCDVNGKRQSIGTGEDFLYTVSTNLMGKTIAFGGQDSVVRIVNESGEPIAELKPGS